ncbi:hypothetical protein [Tepidimonas ignava]|uniref:hypothetical protein n=1 Tax=Tepidimonas ignava TaxID=114249 RepID=UPI002FDAF230
MTNQLMRTRAKRHVRVWAACSLGWLLVASGAVHAAGTSACEAAAQGKKLAGAARASFVTKCERDAQAACEAQAADKKLAGAARTSFVKKCVRETPVPTPGQ